MAMNLNADLNCHLLHGNLNHLDSWRSISWKIWSTSTEISLTLPSLKNKNSRTCKNLSSLQFENSNEKYAFIYLGRINDECGKNKNRGHRLIYFKIEDVAA